MDLEKWREVVGTGAASEGQTCCGGHFCLVRKHPVSWTVMNLGLISWEVGR